MFTGLQHCSELHEGPLAQITKSGGTETVIYVHADHLMTPRYGTNAAGSTVWTWDSGAFGKEAATGTATVNLRFPGQYYDSETTLFYNWNRYYNPATGRYISRDPKFFIRQVSPYLYSEANPLLLTDPRGLEAVGWSGYKFISQRSAAVHAIKLAWTDGRVSLHELAGIIYFKSGCFGYDYKFLKTGWISNIHSLEPNLNASYVDGGSFSAGWHTHPNNVFSDDGEGYSWEDWEWVDGFKKPLYLGTPTGYIKILKPGQDTSDATQVHPEIKP
ncbi:MAG: RHS repeat-associated core domain-containing protein [Alphaproteobacteria bacterium]|nr:RHS repeat-associated core domain-containing protein [Alphaproteobacteria bacterium]QQS57393.1 MAG: RHS repeat-associated core domain-containing protein [Alphaproteobacteria bacterium]